ncbi:MAG TPA: pilus assembly protein PilM [Anaeromyxobacteraceae bacterium]|nr:pilus assembly protein PilM [Anaeromyxobacteraceae bacterium]
MAQRILGLDLGSRQVKAVLLETTLRGFSVADAAELAVAPAADGGPPLRERQAAALRELLAARRWTFEGGVAAVPGVLAASHFVTLPFADPRRIEQTIQYEVEAAIPFPLDQVSWDWQGLDLQAGRSDLYVGVLRKEDLAGLLAALAGAGVDPAIVVPPAPTLASLWAAGVVEDPVLAPDAEMAVDIGWERTHACVVSERRCLFARTFAVGASAIARALSRELGVPEETALAALAPAGDGPAPGPRVEAPLRRAIAPLVRELLATRRAFDVRPSRRPVRRIRLAGGVAELALLREALAADLGTPVEPLRLAGPATGLAGGARLALPLALALRGWLGSRFQRLNLRRGEFASTRSFRDVQEKLTRFGVFGGLVLLLALASSGVKVVALSRQEKLLDQSLCDVTQKVVGKCFDDFSVAESVLRGRGGAGAAVPRVSATNVLAELAARTPAVPLKYERIEISQDKLHLQGTTSAAEIVDRVVSALRASRCFAGARSGGARRRGAEAKFEFTVDADVTCEGSAPPGGKG